MKKNIWALGLGYLAMALTLNVAWAKNTQDIPDVNGTYNVPGHPNVKVRVFVHNPKGPKTNPETTCSVNDPSTGPLVDKTGWHLPSQWNYYVNTSSAPLGAVRNNLLSYSVSALNDWSSATGNKVTFNYKGTTTVNKKGYDGRNIIAWGSASGTALAITYTWYNSQTKQVLETDTIMNKKFPWSWTAFSLTACPPLGSYDAQDILTHELGHWVGLDDEYNSNYAYNTMYGYGGKGEIYKDTLTSGDINAAASIY